jgi:L-seryl-tRNA(Ser) seleniumtransferase
MKNLNGKLRAIPAIDRLVAIAATRQEFANLPREVLVRILRQAADLLRRQLAEGQCGEDVSGAIIDSAGDLLRQEEAPSLKRVVNATGVVLHTNLGRAPLCRRAQERVAAVMAGYSTLEYDVAAGSRGSRHSHVARRLCELTGAEAALVVNNNAAAVLLVLSALAAGREVIVSRGQLVEIGGSFRVPDVMKQSGTKLVEVGTTNKTHLFDYEQAMGPDTAAILKVHTSNYRIVGFTAQPDDADLVALARRHGIPVVEDLGSGTVLPVSLGDWREPAVGERLAAGIDIVTFSGDKLFGGGQAGIIAGKREYIELMRKHPLLRAIRADKLSLAALEGTLLAYTIGSPAAEIPVQRMLQTPAQELAERAAALAAALGTLPDSWRVEVVPLDSQAGGGALPAVGLASYGLSIESHLKAAAVEKLLRCRAVPIITRIQDEKIIIDVRCLTGEDMAEVRAAVGELIRGDMA